MIEADRADRVETAQVVFVRRIVAVPATTSSGECSMRRLPQMALEFRDQLESRLRCPRNAPPASGNRADWPARWSRSDRDPADAAARRNFRRHSRALGPSGSSTRKRMPRGITAISCGSTSMMPSSVAMRQAALLRHDQQLAVGAVEKAVGHRRGWRRRCGCHALVPRRRAVAGDGKQAVDEIRRRLRESAADPSATGRATGPRVEPSWKRALLERPERPCITAGRMR